jgi:hypothetical protein
MTPSKNSTTDLQHVLKNCVKIERLIAQCNELQQDNAKLLRAISNGLTPAHQDEMDMHPQESAILTALLNARTMGIPSVPRKWVAVIARLSPKSGQFRTALANLQKAGHVRKASIGSVTLADKTRIRITPETEQLTTQEILKRVETVFARQEASILCALADPSFVNDWLDRKTLAERSEQNHDSSSFRDRLTQLRKQGFIEFGPNQTVRVLLDWAKKAKAE